MGLAARIACRFAGFFYISMTLVCGLFGLLDGSPKVWHCPNNGAGTRIADAQAAPLLSADFPSQPRLPVPVYVVDVTA
jgi:hypothetical protein